VEEAAATAVAVVAEIINIYYYTIFIIPSFYRKGFFYACNKPVSLLACKPIQLLLLQ
jgi:hypothetical protein